jgi:hypothetical protein
LKKHIFYNSVQKNSQKIDLNITLAEEYITNTTNITFLGLIIDENLSWKCHIEQALIKLSSVCYVMKVVTPLMGDTTLRMIYFAYVQSLVSYGVTHHIVTVYLGCKNVYFELDIETHVGNCLRIGEFYHFIVNIYYG